MRGGVGQVGVDRMLWELWPGIVQRLRGREENKMLILMVQKGTGEETAVGVNVGHAAPLHLSPRCWMVVSQQYVCECVRVMI